MKSGTRHRMLFGMAGLIVLGTVSLMLYGRVFGGHTIQSLSSPDGRVVAEINSSGAGGATETDYLSVMLRTEFNPLRHDVFGGLDYGAKLSLSWLDGRDLVVTCQNCARLGNGQLWPKDMECRWHGISIHYDFIGSSPVVHGSCAQ